MAVEHWQVFGLMGASHELGFEFVLTRSPNFRSVIELVHSVIELVHSVIELVEIPTVRRFPGPCSLVPVLMTEVVPIYRCGAVPDSHRVPS